MKIYHHWRLLNQYKSKRTIIGFGAVVRDSQFGYDVYIGNNTNIYNSTVGDHTYFNSNCRVTDARIGKFCSFGSNVKIGIGSHPQNFVSTHPSFYANNKGFKTFADKMYFKEERGLINIGNDVWIGSDVSILNNINIGHGAIIALGSVVTKDVPDYAIVGGIPARIIKYRFSEEKIKSLLAIKWWNFNREKIQKIYIDFHDTELFIKKYDRN